MKEKAHLERDRVQNCRSDVGVREIDENRAQALDYENILAVKVTMRHRMVKGNLQLLYLDEL